MTESKPSVLVTGGAKRIGKAIAETFGRQGWHVVIHYNRSGDAARKVAEDLPSAETIGCDLSDGDAGVAMVEEFAVKLGDWAVLVNCASIFDPDDVTALDPVTNKRAMQINARTPTRMAQAYLAKAKASGGRRVIQVTDQKLSNPNPDFFSYTMSKHALDATIAMLSMGAANEDDRVYGLAPGAILASHDQTSEEAEISHRLNLLQRRTRSQEIADAAYFLGQGHLASGQTIYCDSGQHLLRQSRDVIYLAREGKEA
ncbi:SDR family oxidoreductase [Qipengyuania sp. 1NDW9]|uniref:SDR family oxidoreductase n=1 Tax=Qipengyuania xiapuensis TaxID=2867236 RepID=A0ABX8ZZ62_9SPHN|nr:SDR family oxidoreductase [Qipengyuania xiapuensis]MBX7492928.1 SDR family oxidoreductase [Qipengyuania xiapuensis]QZD92908.1 SDR family oxidoreductase [Qipengyuania xiapuensis]